jgi:hypothetical protein
MDIMEGPTVRMKMTAPTKSPAERRRLCAKAQHRRAKGLAHGWVREAFESGENIPSSSPETLAWKTVKL